MNFFSDFNKRLKQSKKGIGIMKRHMKQTVNDLLAVGMCVGTPVGLVGLVIVIFTFVILDWDPLVYVVEHILSAPYDRSVRETLSSICLRCLIYICDVIEVARMTSYCLLISLTAILVGKSCMEKLFMDFICVKKSLSYTSEIRLLYGAVEGCARNFFLVGVCMGQLVTTLAICISIFTLDEVPFLSFLTFGFSCTMMILALLLFSFTALSTQQMEAYIVRNRTRHFVSLGGLGRLHLRHKEWNAQVAVKIKCGSLFTIKPSTCFSYFEALSNNVMNSLLLFSSFQNHRWVEKA